MNTGQSREGPRKRGRPRRNDSPPAATRQEERELSPTSVYRNGCDGGGQTPSDTDTAEFSPVTQAPVDGNGQHQPDTQEREPQDHLIDMKEVMRRTGLCRGSVYYLLETSDFPLPVEMGQRIKRWWSGEVNRWMKALPRAKGDLGKWHSQMDNPSKE